MIEFICGCIIVISGMFSVVYGCFIDTEHIMLGVSVGVFGVLLGILVLTHDRDDEF